jgi:peptidyl-prolyl cis-trans isomerase SurA
MTVNGVDVTRSEFEYSFNKNNGDGVIDKKNVDEYADLYSVYKMKVAAALDAKLDTLSSFKQEYAVYRDQQVLPTMTSDAEVLAEARNAYDRAKEQIGPKGLIRPAHIFLRLSTKATPEEQKAVSQRADSVYDALKAGADFAELCKKVSQDRRSAINGGELAWFGPGQVYPEFEEAAYSLQPGEMSRPVLSPDGYHIILMKERKQLEPFEELKDQIVKSFEQQGIREAIARQKIQNVVAEGQMTEEQYMTRRADSLGAADAEMKYLIQEYHDGLLVYEISNRQVWEKASKDEAGLDAWFRAHKKDYAWSEPRFKGIAYHVKDEADVKAVKRSVKGLPFGQWADVLRKTFNPDSIIRIRVEQGIFKAGDSRLVDHKIFKTALDQPVEVNKDYPIDAVYGKKLKKPEDYTDVRNQVVEDYQQALEQEWVAELRQRYTVKLYEDALKTVNQH